MILEFHLIHENFPRVLHKLERIGKFARSKILEFYPLIKLH